MNDTLNFHSFTKIEPIDKGWSGDKKYYVETANCARFFLRMSDISNFDQKKEDFEMMERVYAFGIPTPRPVAFGICDHGKYVCSLWEWLDGEEIGIALAHMDEMEQYSAGIASGELLREIHSFPVPKAHNDWPIHFKTKVDKWVETYIAKPEVHSMLGERIIQYLYEHNNVLMSSPQTFVHGDYNYENIFLMPNCGIYAIDFSSSYYNSYSDPWLDLDNMTWMPTKYLRYNSGQIHGYFNGTPPKEFWDVFTYYLAYDALAALTDPYGLNGIEDGTRIVEEILLWTDDFQKTIPSWYTKDYYC